MSTAIPQVSLHTTNEEWFRATIQQQLANAPKPITPVFSEPIVPPQVKSIVSLIESMPGLDNFELKVDNEQAAVMTYFNRTRFNQRTLYNRAEKLLLDTIHLLQSDAFDTFICQTVEANCNPPVTISPSILRPIREQHLQDLNAKLASLRKTFVTEELAAYYNVILTRKNQP